MAKINLDEKNCLDETGYPLKFFITLTGIYGIDVDYAPQKHGLFSATLEDGFVTIKIKDTPLIEDLSRTIDLTDKEISNNLMVGAKDRSRDNIGLDILKSQVEYANKNNFNFLFVNAFRSGADNSFGGYYLWGKYGYLMLPPDDSTFNQYVNGFINKGVLHTSFSDLSIDRVLKFDEGKAWWKEEGFEWNGVFFTENNSRSRNILKEY